LPLDYPLCHPGGHGLHRVLKLLQLQKYALWQYVRARREDLPELHEGRAEVVQGTAQPSAEVGREDLLQALPLPAVPPDVEDEAEAVAHEDAADLGESPEVPRAPPPG